MATRVSQLLALLIAAVVLGGCAGMGTRYAQNYAVYTNTMKDCNSHPLTITVSGGTTIEQPNPACDRLQAPDHELKYVGPVLGHAIDGAVNTALTVYRTERETSSRERIARMEYEAQVEKSKQENETLRTAFDVAGPHVQGDGNAVSTGGDATGAAPESTDTSTPELPSDLTENL